MERALSWLERQWLAVTFAEAGEPFMAQEWLNAGDVAPVSREGGTPPSQEAGATP